MNYRKLRIAWSVGWGILCLLLIVLWVRSHWKWDALSFPQGGISSMAGSTVIGLGEGWGGTDWRIHTYELDSSDDPIRGFAWINDGGPAGRIPGTMIIMPHWFLVSLFLVFAAAPWLRYRFSLRTLLIAATVVAVLLGLIAWAGQ
jgi:hypothetical protein